MRYSYVIFAVILAFIIVGCGSVGKSIVAKQEWSENYAMAEGVEATSPLMIDGSLRTAGETETPIDIEGTTQYSEAVVGLPEKKSIRRIVIHTSNMETFVVYALAEDGETWEPLQEVKNNDQRKIDLSVSAFTDKIKIKLRKTSDDERIPGGLRSRRRISRAKGKIQEIQIYGLVEEEVPQVAEVPEDQIGEPAVFVTPGASAQGTSAEGQAGASDSPAPGVVVTSQTTQPGVFSAPKPEAPSALVSLESPQRTYALVGPIPVTVNIKIGPDDLVVLEDHVTAEMLLTKLVVKTASGEKILCSEPTPPLSSPRPYRSSGGPVDVRKARTLEAESVVTVDVSNLLECYPMKEPGTYTVQFDTQLAVYSNFVGRNQNQIEDLEMSIRDITTSPHFAQTEKLSVVRDLKEEIERLKENPGPRYIVVGAVGKPLKLTSNVLELVIQ